MIAGQSGRRGLTRLLRDVRNNDRCAAGRKLFASGFADSRCAARDDGNIVFQI